MLTAPICDVLVNTRNGAQPYVPLVRKAPVRSVGCRTGHGARKFPTTTKSSRPATKQMCTNG